MSSTLLTNSKKYGTIVLAPIVYKRYTMIHTYGTDLFSWERIVGDTNADSESDTQYYAFMYYLSLNPNKGNSHSRSYQAVADHLEVTYNTVKKWASQFSWETRATKFDTFMEHYTVDSLSIQNVFDGQVDEMSKMWVTDRATFKTVVRQSLANNVVMTNAIVKGTLEQMSKSLELGEAMNPKAISEILFAIEKQDNMLRRLVGMPTNYRSEDVADDATDDTVYIIGGG